MIVKAAEFHEKHPDPHQDIYSKTIFGFWLYIVTDFMMFATLFATYFVLKESTFGGITSKELFHPPYHLTETLIFLISSFIAGLAGAYAHRNLKKQTLGLFITVFILGTVLMCMIVSDFSRLIGEGHDWRQSAFLSMYFTLIGTFAIHLLLVLLWMVILLIPVFYYGLNPASLRRLTCLRLFWQFLNIIWMFIFSIVYLLGAK